VTTENSPPFQRLENEPEKSSPEWTAEELADRFNRPFGTRNIFLMFPGVETPGYFHSSRWDLKWVRLAPLK